MFSIKTKLYPSVVTISMGYLFRNLTVSPIFITFYSISNFKVLHIQQIHLNTSHFILTFAQKYNNNSEQVTDFNSTPIYIDEYDYLLPDERIAKYPLEKRDSSKLLVYKNDTISTHTFEDIAQFLPENSLLAYNNTRVIQTRPLS